MVRRPPESDEEAYWEPRDDVIDLSVLEGAEGVVHLAGAPIADKRWSEAYKRELVRSRVDGTRVLVNALRQLSSLLRCSCRRSWGGLLR